MYSLPKLKALDILEESNEERRAMIAEYMAFSGRFIMRPYEGIAPEWCTIADEGMS